MIPTRQLSQLHAKRYERVQTHSETLAQYFQSIRDAAQVLRIKESEAQVVQRIIEGLNPTQRACFVFQGPAVSFAQLEFIVIDRNIAFADRTREPVAAVSSRAVKVQATSDDVTLKTLRGGTSKTPTPGKRPVCYHCRKVGHIQRNCFARENSRRSVTENNRS
jgi:methionyl-tRNA formyltransferase